jgi:TatD DNase family protein
LLRPSTGSVPEGMTAKGFLGLSELLKGLVRMLIDIHTHRPDATSGLLIRSLDFHEWLHDGPAVRVGGTCHEHPAMLKDRYFSLGLHPWFIDRLDVAAALALIDAQAENLRLLAIGECGLDKSIATPLDRQIKVFLSQLEIAERWKKPVMIHCVRAFNELLLIKQQLQPVMPWIIHGFNKNLNVAQQCLAQGCYLSFGNTLLNSHSHAYKILPDIPLDRLFLETDAAQDINIDQIYEAAAKILAIEIAVLSEHLHRNFTRVFLHD